MKKLIKLIEEKNFVSKRHFFRFMAFWLLFNSFLTKVSLSVMISFMAITNYTSDDGFARCNCSDHSTQTLVIEQFNWDQYLQGYILTSIYAGYAITYMMGASIAKCIGCKNALQSSVSIVCLLELMTPSFIFYKKALALILLRFLQGLADGISYPTITVMMNVWIPTNERRAFSSWLFNGIMAGTIVANVLSGLVIGLSKRWDIPFYINGSVTLLWLILWNFFIYNSPGSHPYITEEEKEHIHGDLSYQSHYKAPAPWKNMIMSGPVWALIYAQIGFAWARYLMMTHLPKYVGDVLHFPMILTGPISAIPWFAMWINVYISGCVIEFSIKKRYLNRKYARKISCVVAFTLPSVFFLIASYLECNKIAVMACFTLAIAFMAPYYPGVKVNPVDLSPNYAGNILGIVNGIGAIAGMFPPFVASLMTTNVSIEEYRKVFWITFLIYQSTAACYIIFASAEVQWWDEWELKLLVKSYLNVSKSVSSSSFRIDPDYTKATNSKNPNPQVYPLKRSSSNDSDDIKN